MFLKIWIAWLDILVGNPGVMDKWPLINWNNNKDEGYKQKIKMGVWYKFWVSMIENDTHSNNTYNFYDTCGISTEKWENQPDYPDQNSLEKIMKK